MNIMFMSMVAFISNQPQQEIDAAQFARLIASVQSEVRDFELICEGRVHERGTGAGAGPAGPLQQTFQCNYAYRSDGSTYWDILRKPANEPHKRATFATLKDDGKITEIIRIPDRDGARGVHGARKGRSGALAYDGSPGRFIFKYFWDDFLKHPENYTYESGGREEIDGHSCIRILIGHSPGKSPGEGATSTFWIDLERGGHALKREFSFGDELWLRVKNVELTQFALPTGGTVWFPAHAEVETFAPGARADSPPQYYEVYDVVNGSVVFNRDLPDRRFDVNWQGPGTDGGGFAAARREFEGTPAKQKAAKPPRVGPTQVDADLKQRLADADRQAEQLKASDPSGHPWNPVTLGQIALGIAGVAGLLVAVKMRRT